MKAAILVEQNKPLVLADIETTELSVGQVRVRVLYSGVCGKQIDEITGRRSDKFLPHLLGHEGSGIVEGTGAGVRKVKIGDHVVLHWMKGSGIDSEPPRYKWNRTLMAPTLAMGGMSVLLEVSAGWVTTFSDSTIVSENRVTKIDDDIEMDVAALMGCAVTTGLGIVFNNANLKPGQSILVIGAGGLGVNVIQGAALVNAAYVVAVDKPPFGHKFNRVATYVDAVYERTKDWHNQVLFDVVVDTTGVQEMREWGYKQVAKNGKLILAGVPFEGETMTIDSYDLHGGKQIIGSHGGSTNPDVDIPRYLGLYKRGKLKLKEQITHVFPLEKINEAIEVVKRGEAGRCLIKMV